MAAAHVGATLLPVLAVKPPVAQSDNIHLLGFSDSHPSRSLAMVWRRSSAMGSFLVRLAAVLGDLPPALLAPQCMPADEPEAAHACTPPRGTTGRTVAAPARP